MVGEHHHGGYGGVEGHGFDVFGDLLHGLVEQSCGLVVHLDDGFRRDGGFDDVVEFVLEAYDPGYLARLPWFDGLEWSHEHLVQP